MATRARIVLLLLFAFGGLQSGAFELARQAMLSIELCAGECSGDDDDGDCPPQCDDCACSLSPRLAVTAFKSGAPAVVAHLDVVGDVEHLVAEGIVQGVFRPPRAV